MAAPFPVTPADLDLLVDGAHGAPHDILGPHQHDGAVTVRTLRPLAQAVTVVMGDQRFPMEHEYRGVWQVVLPLADIPDYKLDVEYDGNTLPAEDPYRFLPTLGEVDLHLIGEGRHEQLWRVLGAHTHVYDSLHGPVEGTSFAVWAPNARGVRVVGDFNYWDGAGHPMRSLGSSGVWELFVPGVGNGTKYKFGVLGADFTWRDKADPVAFYAEPAPQTASVVFTSGYQWQDSDWMQRRAESNPHTGPMSVYEVHLGSWRKGLSYVQLAD